MGKYSNEAAKYQKNAQQISDTLDKCLNTIKSINTLITTHKSDEDYITKEMKESNNEIVKNIDNIKKSLAINAEKLMSEAKKIDRRIEEELRKQEELKKQETDLK